MICLKQPPSGPFGATRGVTIKLATCLARDSQTVWSCDRDPRTNQLTLPVKCMKPMIAGCRVRLARIFCDIKSFNNTQFPILHSVCRLINRKTRNNRLTQPVIELQLQLEFDDESALAHGSILSDQRAKRRTDPITSTLVAQFRCSTSRYVCRPARFPRVSREFFFQSHIDTFGKGWRVKTSCKTSPSTIVGTIANSA